MGAFELLAESWRTCLVVTHSPSSSLSLEEVGHKLPFGGRGSFPSHSSLLTPHFCRRWWGCVRLYCRPALATEQL